MYIQTILLQPIKIFLKSPTVKFITAETFSVFKATEPIIKKSISLFFFRIITLMRLFEGKQ